MSEPLARTKETAWMTCFVCKDRVLKRKHVGVYIDVVVWLAEPHDAPPGVLCKGGGRKEFR